MMKHTMLRLKPGVTPVEENGAVGLSLAGRIRLAKDARQAALIRALSARAQPLEMLQTILHERDGPSMNEAEAALELATFILNFEEYIES